MQDIGKIIPTEGTEAVNRLVSRVTAAPANTNQIVMNNVSTRMMITSGSLLFAGLDNAEGIVVANNENPGDDFREVAQGIAAGSNAYDKYGVWLSAHAGKALQKDYKGEAGFKSDAEGFSLGVDTMISERTSIGAAVSNSFDHIKYRNSGNKTDTSSWVGAIYGNHKLKNNWFIKGTALFNRTRMNSKDLRVIYGGYGTAHAKYNLISYGGEAAVGFMHHFKNDLMLVPTIGFRVLHNNKSNFMQYGNTYQNNTLSTNAINNYSAIGGLSLSKNFVEYGIIFTPEAHVNVQYGINQQTPKGTFVSALTPNQPTNFIGTKSNKITSIYGLGLTGSSDRIEVGITGDVTIANRYVGYQGSLKVKVMF
jgi:outer membrane autotransporter protein